MYKTPKKDGVDESPLDSTGNDLRKSLPEGVRIDSGGYLSGSPPSSPENESEQSEYQYRGEEKKDEETDDDDDDDDASNVSSLSHDLSDLAGKKGKARMAAEGRLEYVICYVVLQ